jgi:hypothetical protein
MRGAGGDLWLRVAVVSRLTAWAGVCVVATVGLAAVLLLARGGRPAGGPRDRVGQAPAVVSSSSIGQAASGGSRASGVGVTASGAEAAASPVQIDPEAVDPGLAGEHRRDLSARPVFQHLPYRDREIGVGFDEVVGGGKLELLVTYLGSRAAAERDFHRLLGRYRDPGTAYVERYRRVF